MNGKQAVMQWGILFWCVAAITGFGCTTARYARTSASEALHSYVRISHGKGEVLCSKGAVCTEVEVVQVDVEPRKGGKVQVALRNRTGASIVVQIALEIVDEKGAILDRTVFQNVPLPPREQQVWDMPGIYQPNSLVRVLLRDASP